MTQDAASAPNAENQTAPIASMPLSQRILARYLRQKYAAFQSIEKMSDLELIERYRNHSSCPQGAE